MEEERPEGHDAEAERKEKDRERDRLAKAKEQFEEWKKAGLLVDCGPMAWKEVAAVEEAPKSADKVCQEAKKRYDKAFAIWKRTSSQAESCREEVAKARKYQEEAEEALLEAAAQAEAADGIMQAASTALAKADQERKEEDKARGEEAKAKKGDMEVDKPPKAKASPRELSLWGLFGDFLTKLQDPSSSEEGRRVASEAAGLWDKLQLLRASEQGEATPEGPEAEVPKIPPKPPVVRPPTLAGSNTAGLSKDSGEEKGGLPRQRSTSPRREVHRMEAAAAAAAAAAADAEEDTQRL